MSTDSNDLDTPLTDQVLSPEDEESEAFFYQLMLGLQLLTYVKQNPQIQEMLPDDLNYANSRQLDHLCRDIKVHLLNMSWLADDRVNTPS